MHWGDIRVPWLMPRDAMNSTFVLRFTRTEAISGYHDWCRGMLEIQRLYCVLHALRRYQGTMIDAEGCYKFNVCIVFYTRWGDIRVPWSMPRDVINSTFVLRCTRVEAISGYRDWCRGMLQIQLLCCTLHALRRYQGTMIDSEGCYKLNVCIVFCTRWGDIRVPWLMPRDAMNSTVVLRFTRIEAISGNHDWCRGML
jgi:hypothetical protein